jgi:hypothetical protein
MSLNCRYITSGTEGDLSHSGHVLVKSVHPKSFIESGFRSSRRNCPVVKFSMAGSPCDSEGWRWREVNARSDDLMARVILLAMIVLLIDNYNGLPNPCDSTKIHWRQNRCTSNEPIGELFVGSCWD